MRPSWVEVDLGAIRRNTAAIAGAIAPSEVCAVVKADGYGHGDVPSAEAAMAGGATRLAVATLGEGARLREAGIEAPMLLLSEPIPEDLPSVIEWGLTPTVYRTETVRALESVAPAGAGVHVKVDTGMHRVGASPDRAVEVATAVASGPLALEGLWTHFAVAETDADFTRAQLALLQEVAAELAKHGIAAQTLHAANTAGALTVPESRLDFSRIGLGLYGLSPAEDIGADLGLTPAMRVVSRVVHLQRHPSGTRPSYGRIRPLDGEATVATVPIGYADGLSRRLGFEGGSALIGGTRYPFAGSVTMDQVMVDIGDDPVAVGDEVVLLGRQGDAEIGADEWARRLDTINWEVVCGFGPRLPRRYVQ